MDKTSLVKVFLHDRGQDVESAWCQPVAEKGDSALFRLVNVPFLHEKPTFGDVIPAKRSEDGSWEWDRDGASQKRVGERLHEDGGRYALIVDYTMRTDADFGALVNALEKKHDVIGEGCFGPRGEEPGRLYLAAPRAIDPAAVMAAMTTLGRGFRFVLVHPTPPKRAAKPKAKGRAKTTQAAPKKRPKTAAKASKKAPKKTAAKKKAAPKRPKSKSSRATRRGR